MAPMTAGYHLCILARDLLTSIRASCDMRDAPLQRHPSLETQDPQLLKDVHETGASAQAFSSETPLVTQAPLGETDVMSEDGRRHSYGEILTSSALIGGSTIITILASILRTKLVAVFLGPGGLGLMGVFTSLTTVVSTASGMGISTSGVRQIAEAVNSGDDEKLARAVAAVRKLRWRLGLAGAVLLAALSVPISRITFGNTDHALTIALLALVVVAQALYEQRVALLQGFRRMQDLARVAILSTTLTAALTVPVLVFWREHAVVALLLLASATMLFSSWWFARKITTPRINVSWREALPDIRVVLRLGIVTMAAALMVAVIAYAVRVVLVRELGFDAVGIYQSATALSAVYCGFILSAMGADFLPRLSAVAGDDRESNRLVNEQTEVGLLLSLPGICATLAFAPIIVQILYSGRFGLASEVLRWQVLGVFLRVASWPLGYLLLAKKRAALYFWTELSYNLLHAALIWVCLQFWGLLGTGIAFFGLYIYYSLLMTVVTRRLTGFRWSQRNKQRASIAVPTVAFVFSCPLILPSPWHFVVAGAATTFAALYSSHEILALTGRRGFRQTIAAVKDMLRGGDPVLER
jgi:antigen flippase